jgi:hypothetical protein
MIHWERPVDLPPWAPVHVLHIELVIRAFRGLHRPHCRLSRVVIGYTFIVLWTSPLGGSSAFLWFPIVGRTLAPRNPWLIIYILLDTNRLDFRTQARPYFLCNLNVIAHVWEQSENEYTAVRYLSETTDASLYGCECALGGINRTRVNREFQDSISCAYRT